MRRLLIAAAYLFGLVLCTGYAEAAIVPCDSARRLRSRPRRKSSG
jgi:hypothetical protein